MGNISAIIIISKKEICPVVPKYCWPVVLNAIQWISFHTVSRILQIQNCRTVQDLFNADGFNNAALLPNSSRHLLLLPPKRPLYQAEWNRDWSESTLGPEDTVYNNNKWFVIRLFKLEDRGNWFGKNAGTLNYLSWLGVECTKDVLIGRKIGRPFT